MLQEEAVLIAEKLGITGFSASNGWLYIESFKKQHGIFNMSMAGEEADVGEKTVESCCERAREISKGWKPEDIWNMDETGTFWQGLPEKILSEKKTLQRWKKGKTMEYVGVFRECCWGKGRPYRKWKFCKA